MNRLLRWFAYMFYEPKYCQLCGTKLEVEEDWTPAEYNTVTGKPRYYSIEARCPECRWGTTGYFPNNPYRPY